MPNHREMVHYAVSKALKERGLSHKQVAEILGVSSSSVSNAISQGKFTIDRATRWSEALGIEMEVFLEGKEPMPPSNFKFINETLEKMRAEINALRHDVDSLLAERSKK